MCPHFDLVEMLSRCRVQADGFLSLSESTLWRVGAVLFARRSRAFALVRKARVARGTYEFAGLCALPGGMARRRDPVVGFAWEPDDLLRASRLERAHREAGLAPEHLRALVAAPLGPIVTSYSAKGRQRFTLVVPFVCDVEAGAQLQVADESVDECFWMSVPPEWEGIAPANRVAIAHLLWSELDEGERAVARPHVLESTQRCSKWATMVGVPPVPPPWTASDELIAWRSAWPS
jgi:hypothetical protein